MYVIKTDEMKVPLKVFSTEGSIEEGCIEQMKKVASLPFLHKHVALMPDGHFGMGASIGAVVATKGVVIPSLVGVDIGCGMCAVKISLTEIDTETLKKIMGEIREAVPVGFNKHKEMQGNDLMPELNIFESPFTTSICHKEYNNARKSLGTLGGGNHFIEIQKGNDGHIWIMIHSGSRNLGLKIANHYNDLAKQLNKKWHSGIDPKWNLAFLPLGSEEGQDYLREMQYCVDFALANRKLMMDRILKMFLKIVPSMSLMSSSRNSTEDMINIAHNYAVMENHFGQNVLIHRKGATLAREGTIGIIPGSQGTKSYIVKGKGNKESFESCSHGAGRRMGRKDACRNLDLEAEQKILNDQGVIHSVRNNADLEEAPSAYKDISVVMDNQKDLVEVLVELTPLGVIKA